jgi:hypothetical protein
MTEDEYVERLEAVEASLSRTQSMVVTALEAMAIRRDLDGTVVIGPLREPITCGTSGPGTESEYAAFVEGQTSSDVRVRVEQLVDRDNAGRNIEAARQANVWRPS